MLSAANSPPIATPYVPPASSPSCQTSTLWAWPESVQLGVGRDHRRREPGAFLSVAGGGTAVDHAREIAIAGDRELAAANRPREPPRDAHALELEYRPRIERPPGHRLIVPNRPGKDAVAIGVEQPLRREPTADADQAVGASTPAATGKNRGAERPTSASEPVFSASTGTNSSSDSCGSSAITARIIARAAVCSQRPPTSRQLSQELFPAGFTQPAGLPPGFRRSRGRSTWARPTGRRSASADRAAATAESREHLQQAGRFLVAKAAAITEQAYTNLSR